MVMTRIARLSLVAVLALRTAASAAVVKGIPVPGGRVSGVCALPPPVSGLFGVSTLGQPLPLLAPGLTAAGWTSAAAPVPAVGTALPVPAGPPVLTLLAPLLPSPQAAGTEKAVVAETTLGRLSAELPGAAPPPSDLTGGKDHADRTFQLKLGETQGSVGVYAGGSGGAIQTATARPSAQKLTFVGVGARDVYNPTAPFLARFRGRKIEVLAARVEPRSSESSEAMFFERAGERWRPLAGAPVLKLQDPFFSRVGRDLIVGGVETFPEEGGGLGYRTVFYRGQDLADLRPFARGPDGMKDIRLIQLPKGNILVLTRPQGEVGGAGKIAVTMIDGLGSLGPDAINRAKVYEDLFTPDEWGGANELHLLKNGLVGVLGHVARFDAEGDRHYDPMAFAVDPATGRRWPMRILLERSQLPPGASKRPDLADVLFSGGLVRGEGGTAELYVGAGDAEVYRVTIPDPFADLENSSR